MKRLLTLACVALSGCQLPGGVPCTRVLTGNVDLVELPSFDAVALAGQPVALIFNSPISACERDALDVRLEGTAPDSSTFTLQPSGPPARVMANLVQVRATFTPPTPGFYSVRAAFEPSLGVRTLYVLAAEVPGEPPPAVEVARHCAQPWALTPESVACELPTGEIELAQADGGLTTFEGAGLAVVGEVLWSVTHEGVLERREAGEGGLRLTFRLSGFSLQPLRAEQGTDFALRRGADGRPVLIRLDTGPELKAWGQLDLAEAVLLVHPIGVSSFPCGADVCLGRLIASDPTTVWALDNGHFGSLRRPIARSGFDGLLEFPEVTPPALFPRGPFERIPFWVPTAQGRAVLVSTDLGEPTAIAWERDEVLDVGRGLAVLRSLDGGATVRVVRRWR